MTSTIVVTGPRRKTSALMLRMHRYDADFAVRDGVLTIEVESDKADDLAGEARDLGCRIVSVKETK